MHSDRDPIPSSEFGLIILKGISCLALGTGILTVAMLYLIT